MILAAGRVFGPYRLLRSVAADTVTTTYVAAPDEGDGATRPGAPRFLVRIAGRYDDADEHAADLVRQFFADAQRAGAVDHPSIIRPRDLGVIDDHPYVATTLVRAVPLGQMLALGGAINESTALAVFAQLAGALDAAHRADVVHGALSPTTIWVGPSAGRGAAYVGYLIGFGSAQMLRDHVTAEPRGAVVDDILYVAPEQLRGEPVTGTTDQYSLACALYHTLSGQPPFVRPSRAELYGAHLLAPAPLLAHDEASAQSIGVALRRGMSKRPAERYASCGKLINAALPAGAPPAESVAPTGTRPPAAPTPLSRTRALVLIGLGLILVGVVLWLLLSPAAGGPAAVTRTASAPAAVSSTDRDPPAAGEPGRWSAAVADAPVVDLEVLDGMIVATAEDGTVAGVRPAAGRVRWRADAGAIHDLAAAGATVVYVGEVLTALDAADGGRRWRVDGDLPTSLLVTDDTVVGAYASAPTQPVRGVALDDGSVSWLAPAPTDSADPPPTVGAGGGLVYLLQRGQLSAVDPPTAVGDAPGQQPVIGPAWRIDAGDAWPLLAPLGDGVALATRDGEVCVYGANAGSRAWCEDVPGAADAAPVVVGTSHGVVVATPAAVVLLDREMGAPRWSVSPGSARNLVAVSRAAVVTVDGDGTVSALDTATGEEMLRVPALGAVTALAAHERWALVGTADGRIRRFDIDAG